MNFEHPDDQTVTGVYQIDHHTPRKEFKVTGIKRRTGGTVIVAVFQYRTNNQKLYLPTQAQASAVADMLSGFLNSNHVVLKDGR